MVHHEGGQEHIDATAEKVPILRRLAPLAIVLLICAGTRIYSIRGAEAIAKDGVRYTAMARLWAEDPAASCKSDIYHPGYPALVATVHGVLGERWLGDNRQGWEQAGQIVSLTAYLAATAAVWVLTGVAFNWRVAWIAALLFGSGRKWASLGADVLSDSTAVGLQLIATLLALLALRQLQRNQWRAVATAAGVGLCGGVGYLVRGEAVLVVAAAGVLWIVLTAAKKLRWRQTLLACAVAGVVAAACAAPYMLTIGGLTNKHVLGGSVTAIRTAAGVEAPEDLAAGKPGILIFGAQLTEAIHPVCAGVVGLWLLFWVVEKLRRRKSPPGTLLTPTGPMTLFTVTVIAFSAPVLIIHYNNTGYMAHRYLMFIAALLAPLIGAAIGTTANLLVLATDGRRGGRILSRAAVGALTAGLTFALMAHALTPLHAVDRPIRLMGLSLHAAAAPESVLTDHHLVSHYAESSPKPMKAKRVTAAMLVERLRALGTDEAYLALSRQGRRRDPATDTLLHSNAFALIRPATVSDATDAGVRLYRVRIDKLPEAPLAAADDGQTP